MWFSPKMKALGIKNRCRISDIPPSVKYIAAIPRMALYIDYAADIYGVYLKYVAPQDIHVYSIDESFLDVTRYLQLYRTDAVSFAKFLMQEIERVCHIPYTAGVGTNLYLAKIALDITAKHAPDRIGVLMEELYRETLWDHRPITDFWMIAGGTAKRLERYGVYDMRGITQLPEKIGGLDVTALLLGLGTVAIIYLFPLITKKIPATLVALIAMTVVAVCIHFDPKLTIGEIPSGFPMPFFVGHEVGGIEWLAVIKMAVIPALTLAGLGSIDTLLTSVVADNTTKTKHNSNRELIGQGIGNVAVGIFCGLPGAGATMRTVVNINSGGRTRLSGMIHGLFLLAVLLGLGSLVKYVPLSVLAGILITVGVGIIDFKGLKDLLKIPRADAVVLLTVLFLTVFVDLLIAVGIGMVIACVLFMKRASDLVEGSYHLDQISTFDKEIPWEDEKVLTDEIRSKIYIQRLNGPIFFGSITKFQEVMNSIPEDAKVVIIRMRLVSFMDQSGLYAMETAIKDLQARGVTVLMTIIQPQPMYMLTKMNVIPNVVPQEHTFATFEDCGHFLSEQIDNLTYSK